MKVEENAEIIDVFYGYRKGAASFKHKYPIRIERKWGNITISQHEKDPEKGLITVEVDPSWMEQIEGRSIVIWQGNVENGRELLQGIIIVNGKVASK